MTVTPGVTANGNVNLISALEKADSLGETVQLAAFTVSSEREGNAKAIMDQRQSMNVSNIVAADSFGNIAESRRWSSTGCGFDCACPPVGASKPANSTA